MRTVNIGVVGCGAVAQRVYLPEFHRLHGKAALVAVCDRVEERARAAQQRFGARTYYTDLERFLRDSNADIVVNLTPHQAHMPVSMAALEAGRHVYTEKPLAQSVDDATQLIEAARAHHVKLACAPVILLLPTAQRWRHGVRWCRRRYTPRVREVAHSSAATFVARRGDQKRLNRGRCWHGAGNGDDFVARLQIFESRRAVERKLELVAIEHVEDEHVGTAVLEVLQPPNDRVELRANALAMRTPFNAF